MEAAQEDFSKVSRTIPRVTRHIKGKKEEEVEEERSDTGRCNVSKLTAVWFGPEDT